MSATSPDNVLVPRKSPNRLLRSRALWWIAGILAAIAIISQLTSSSFEPVKGGPNGSSFVTSPKGVAAFAELAKQYGFRIGRRTAPIEKLELDTSVSRDVLVVFGATFTTEEAAAAKAFVERGGHLIADVPAFSPWTEVFGPLATESFTSDLEAGPAEGNANGATLPLVVQGSDVFPDASVERFRASDTSVAFNTDVAIRATRESRPIAVQRAFGEGSVTLLSDTTFLENELLDREGNAAFALDLLRGVRGAGIGAGIGTGPAQVTFAEEHHGYGEDLTPKGLPKNVKWFLIGLVASVLVLMWSVSRRNGPPEYPDRELPPARSDYVAALGHAIDRTSKAPPLPKLTSSSAVPTTKD